MMLSPKQMAENRARKEETNGWGIWY